MKEATYEATMEAEESLIGALLIEGTDNQSQSVREVKAILNPEDFSNLRCRRIYKAIMSVPHADVVSVARKMHEDKTLMANDCAEITMLVARCPCSLDYLHYAKAVVKYSTERNPNRKPPMLEKFGVKLD